MRWRKSNVLVLISLLLLWAIVSYLTVWAGSVSVEAHSQTIRGTLSKGGQESLVIVVPGSGPTDRDGNSSLLKGHNDSLRMLAKELKGKGISTYRYDKQTGEGIQVFEDMILDLQAVIHHFSDKGYDHIYLAGHSQGALVAMVAAETSQVDGVISLCGAGRPIGETLADQLEIESVEPLLSKVRAGESLEEESDLIQMIFNDRNVEFLESWMAYNPAEICESLQVPVLLVGGTMDTQAMGVELEHLAAATTGARVLEIQGMNHLLKMVADEDENVDSYTSPDYPISDILIEALAGFVMN